MVVPGPIGQRTGGYIYDARMVAGLRDLGWHVAVHELTGAFPDADEEATLSLSKTLGGLPEGAVVVVDGLAMGALPGPVRANQRRLRILSLVHHALADETGLTGHERERYETLERDALGACRGVVVTSESTAARVEHFGVAPRRVRAVRPGTDPARLATGPSPGEPPRWLCVATVTPRKGQDVLVRALVRLRGLPWTGVCVGSLTRSPAYATRVRTQVVAAGLDDRITFFGECDAEALEELYHESSLVVLPSYFEGFGMVLTEALARGLPIVTTTGGAIPGTVPAGAAILVTPGDDEALADALRDLIRAESPRRTRMAAEARRHATRLPRWEQAARQFGDAVLDLAGDSGDSES